MECFYSGEIRVIWVYDSSLPMHNDSSISSQVAGKTDCRIMQNMPGTNSRYDRRNIKVSMYVCEPPYSSAGWLSYLERTDHPIKPHLPLPRLIWPHHYPPLDHRSPSSTIKYIPQAVLGQLDRHLHQLTTVYIPVMIVLRASGWRISDVLALKWETCLEQQNEKYSLVGDIQKTRILGHRIPISQEVAAVIQVQIV